MPKKKAPANPLEAPTNALCMADHPTDVIYAARCLLKFTSTSRPTNGDTQDQEYLDGKEWVWATIHDAWVYAQELTDRQPAVAEVKS